jgi:uncharacterized protein with HEPN domain
MSRDKQVLTDILLAIQQVLRYAEVLDRDRLAQDDEKQAAILYRIIIIGEATKRLSMALRSQYSEIPWRQMAGLRDVVADTHAIVWYLSKVERLSETAIRMLDQASQAGHMIHLSAISIVERYPEAVNEYPEGASGYPRAIGPFYFHG